LCVLLLEYISVWQHCTHHIVPLYSHVLYDLVSSHTLRESLSSPTVWKDKLPLVKREIERLRATVSEYLAEEVVNSCNLQWFVYNSILLLLFSSTC